MEPDFRLLFESAPGLFLVVQPDAPRYTVVAASDAYLQATRRQREEMRGRGLFEVWPPNPADPESSNIDDMAASLERVLRQRAPDAMAIQRHDVCVPERGGVETRHWKPLNAPVFGREGELVYIIHRVEDVTELVRSEGAGQEASTADERRFRELFDRAPEGIFVAGPDGRYTDVDAAGCRLLGYSRDELVGRSIADFVEAEELARQATLKRRILEGGIESSEWRLRRKDGTFVPVELAASALSDGHLLGFARDIAERQSAAEAIRVSTAKYSGIVDMSVDAIISIDAAQRITMFNAGAETIFGYSKAEIVGAPLDALLPERFRSSHRRHVTGFAMGAETSRPLGARHLEILGLRKNGEEFVAEAAISKLDVGGETLLTVSLRDVTERKRAEDEERLLAEIGRILVAAGPDSERLLTDVANALVHGSADWCSVDIIRDGDLRRLRVVHKDPAMASICEELERYPARRDSRGPIPAVLETRAPVLMSDVPPDYLESIAQSPEHLRLMRALDPGSFIVVPLIARGQPLGTLGLGASRASRRFGPADVHLAERLASRLELAVDHARLHEALERALLARDEVLGIVAHDLRSPLNAIVLIAQSLLRPGHERRDTKPIEMLRRTATRMNGLIQDLLDVARLEAGQKLAIEPQQVSPASLVAGAVEQQEAAIAASSRCLEVDVPAVLPDVWADRARVAQVFDNLLANAIKFARRRIAVGAAVEGDEVRFWIANDGAGITPEAARHAFDRFWQASATDHRGVGLGLSIVKAIVEAHGGRVWVQSDEDAETRFCFTLPTSASQR